MDLLSNCPSCEKSWDGGSIKNALMEMECFTSLSERQIENLATKNYGWTPENNKRFSLVVLHDIEGVVYVECPHCKKAFELTMGEEYRSIIHLKAQLYEATGEDVSRL
jgi:phage FluMu protein Com